jgi:murein DD-endopeptidase MepM/ murein hydrolase activator NlpD
MRRIGLQDNRIINVVRAAKKDATQTAERLDTLEARQQEITASVLARRNEVAAVRQQLVDRRVGYQQTQAGKQRALASVASDRQNLQNHLDDLEAAAARVTSELQNLQSGSGFNNNNVAGPIKQGSGSMIWPVNGPVTSPFCERRAWESCHPGIDIGVPSGTPVHAAMAGRVILEQGAGSSGGYGNFICVQHTATMSTCYAHNTSFSVGLGANVSQGQVIAVSGCTGRCFGPHVHFEVRINGAVTNPMNYL